MPALEYRTAIIVRHDDKIVPTFKRIHLIRNRRTEKLRGAGRDLG